MNSIKEILDYLSKAFQWWVIVLPWEMGLRVRLGKKVVLLKQGTHFRLPFFDVVYVQSVRIRVVSMPLQTVSTKDKHSLSIASVVGYSICDIRKLYDTLHQPESTICNMVLGETAEYISGHHIEDCDPEMMMEHVKQKLNSDDYGIKYEYIKIIGFSVVKTIRLLQDQHWTPDGLDLKNKS